MRLLLVRHAQTPSNVAGLLDTAVPGPGLTGLGLRQAAAIPGALREAGVDTIAVSHLHRTALTAAPLAQERGITPMPFDGLQEIEAGDLEMRGDKDSVHAYLSTAFAWARGELDERMPGSGVDGGTFFERYDAAVDRAARQAAASLVVVSHGAAIRVWASARVQGLGSELMHHTPLHNTAVIEAEGDPDAGWRLVRWSPEPAGGAALRMPVEADPTGEPAE